MLSWALDVIHKDSPTFEPFFRHEDMCQAMEEKEITAPALAEEMGVDVDTVRGWMTGWKPPETLKELKAICEALEVRAVRIFR